MEFFMGGFIYISVILMLSFVLAFMGLILSKKKNLNREKLSSFECGFDPMESSRNTFSLRFFLLAIVFLIFDIEIVLLFPYIYSLWMGVNLTLKLFMLAFIFVLIFGLIHEFNEGSLDWS